MSQPYQPGPAGGPYWGPAQRPYPGQPFGHPPRPGPYPPPGHPGLPEQRRSWPDWLCLIIVAAAVLLGVVVLLPWVKASVPDSSTLPLALRNLIDSEWSDGFGPGYPWGWLTPASGVVAGALGLIGALTRKRRLACAAILPAIASLISLLLVLRFVARANSRSAANAAHTPAAHALAVGASVDYGWDLALVLTFVIVVLSVAAFVTAGRRSPTSGTVHNPGPEFPRGAGSPS